MAIRVREATAEELLDWDERTVRAAHGSVHQSRAWAAYRHRFGWQPIFLVGDDGARILALGRPWPLVGGSGYYISRGPIPADDPVTTAARLEAAAGWLEGHGATTVSSDAEVPAETGYHELLVRYGWRQIEEIQPSRHRLSLDLAGADSEDELLGRFHATTRNMIRAAERTDLALMVHAGPLALAASSGGGDPGAGDPGWPAGLADELERLHGLMVLTARRRGFALLTIERFLDWSRRAYETGLLVVVTAHSPGGQLVAGATLYRHGRRLTYSHAADEPALRSTYPGAVRLVLWRAIRLALDEGCDEVDLGGVDVRGARRRPSPGEPAHGMLTFKESFGARWIELSGAHERVFRPVRHTLGRAAASVAWRISSG